VMSDYGEVKNSKPIMVSGVYRSGTTFLTAMLGAHSELKATSSTVKFLRFCLNRYGDITKVENQRRLISDTHKRLRVRWGLSIDERNTLRQVARYEQPSYAAIYDLLMRDMLLGKKGTASRWVEKLAVQWEDIPVFLRMFPNGKVIHIYRDPRDIAASYKKMTFEPGKTYLDAAFNFRGAMECVKGLQLEYRRNLLAVKVEEISERPEESIKRICRFLKIRFEKSMLDTNQFHAQGEDWATNTSFSLRYNGIPTPQARWPEELSKGEVIFIEMITQPYFSECGYTAANYSLDMDIWIQIFDFLSDPFLKERFNKWLSQGKGSQGYRTDPYCHEMKIVFGENGGDCVANV